MKNCKLTKLILMEIVTVMLGDPAYRDEYDLPSPETGPAQKGSDDE
jgi:hypothetical protein